MNLTQVPTDDWGYPNWEWPDTASHLLFDLGYSYGLMSDLQIMLKGLRYALDDHESEGSPANTVLKDRLDDLLGRIDNFGRGRLSLRDEIYNAGEVAAAKLDKRKDENES